MRLIDRKREGCEPVPDPAHISEANLFSSPIPDVFLCVIESGLNKTGEDFVDGRDRQNVRKE